MATANKRRMSKMIARPPPARPGPFVHARPNVVRYNIGMISVRRAGERGHENYGWLDTQHTFSFGEYHDPRHMGFRTLRVINEDRVKPESGFGTHSHRDMEIVSYVLGGELAHEDSMGTGSVIRPGDVQRMSAGTGVTHSEWNHSKTEHVHFLQIWILPDRRGITPSYEQKTIPEGETQNRLRLVASADGREGSVVIHQDAAIYVAKIETGREVAQEIASGRHAWVQVARGAVEVTGTKLAAGDGAAVSEEKAVAIRASEAAEVLVFDLG
jgi:quercetin 2,3-dioxygenase